MIVNEFSLSEECADRKIAYTLFLDEEEHDGSLLELFTITGEPPSNRIVPRAGITIDEVWINEVHMFELVGRLSSATSKSAFLQVCINDGTHRCSLHPGWNGCSIETANGSTS